MRQAQTMKDKVKFGIIEFLCIVWLLGFAVQAERYVQLHHDIDWARQGFERIDTTCYLITGRTATGTPTHYGVAACNPHLGECVELYTLEGEYLGLFEVCDTGSASGLVEGTSIDIWMPSMEEAQEWMTYTQGQVYAKFIKGEG